MQLIEYLPLYFQNIQEFEAMMEAEQPEVNRFNSAIDTQLKNEFIETLDEAGCEHWEKIMGITPSSAATLEDRRFIIASKYKESLPYTWDALVARLNSTLGESNYTIEEKTEDYTLELRIMLTRKYQMSEIVELLENLVPCNIILDIELMYKQNQDLYSFKYGELSNFTHTQLREEEIS